MRDDKRKRPMVAIPVRIAYGLGSGAHGALSFGAAGMLLYFYAGLNLAPVLSSVAICFGVLCGAAALPFIGAVASNVRAITGKRHLGILISIVALPLLNCAIWSFDGQIHWAATFLLIIAFVVFFFVVTNLCAVSLASLGTEISGDSFERRAHARIRQISYSAGAILAMAVLGFVAKSYADFGYIISIIFTVCALGVYFATITHLPRLNAKEDSDQKQKIADFYKEALSGLREYFNKKRLGYVLCLFAFAIVIVLSPFVVKDFLGKGVEVYALLAASFLASFLLAELLYTLFHRLLRAINVMLWLSVLCMAGLLIAICCFALQIHGVISGSYSLMMASVLLGGLGAGGIFKMKNVEANKCLDAMVKAERTQAAERLFCVRLILFECVMAACYLVAGVVLTAFKYSIPAQPITAMGVGYFMFLVAIGCTTAVIILFYYKDREPKPRCAPRGKAAGIGNESHEQGAQIAQSAGEQQGEGSADSASEHSADGKHSSTEASKEDFEAVGEQPSASAIENLENKDSEDSLKQQEGENA